MEKLESNPNGEISKPDLIDAILSAIDPNYTDKPA